MATINAVASVTVRDEPGEKVAMTTYYTFPDTQTLADVMTYIGTLITRTDAVTDGVIDHARLTLSVPLPGGLKASPVAGSDTEETGLLTFALLSPASKSQGIDIPAIAQAALLSTDKNRINVAETAMAALITFLTTGGAGIPSNNLWSSGMGAVRSALKTFRKHRRQAKRV